MIRSFNYTSRQKLTRDHVALTLDVNQQPATFTTQLTLSDLRLPGKSRIFVEAYNKTNFMRFDYGTVSAYSEPADRKLSAFHEGADFRFRVKIVDEFSGKILALGENFGQLKGTPQAATESLIRVLVVPESVLGQEVWRLIWDDGPVLQLNMRQPDIKELITRNPLYQTLILPVLLRNVLHRLLVIDNKPEDGSPDADRRIRWMQFAQTLTGQDAPTPEECDEDISAADRWIDEVVANFCERHKMLNKWMASLEQLGVRP